MELSWLVPDGGRRERTQSSRSLARLVVLAGEIGGRWSEDTIRFLSLLVSMGRHSGLCRSPFFRSVFAGAQMGR